MLPLASVAVQVTSVEPTGNFAPGAWSQVTAGLGSSLSVATGSGNVTLAPVGSLVVWSMFGGAAGNTGAVVSASSAPAATIAL